MVQLHNGILLSHKKKRNWVICSEVDGPRDYHIKWSKSDRERQILYITYLWNLKKWCKWTYKTNRLTDNSQKKRNIKDPQTHEAKYKFTENERDTNPNNKMKILK